jgi:hypothetical protein
VIGKLKEFFRVSLESIFYISKVSSITASMEIMILSMEEFELCLIVFLGRFGFFISLLISSRVCHQMQMQIDDDDWLTSEPT